MLSLLKIRHIVLASAGICIRNQVGIDIFFQTLSDWFLVELKAFLSKLYVNKLYEIIKQKVRYAIESLGVSF